MTKTALVVGVTGQDGAYLAHYLLSLGYRVVGTSRDSQMCDASRIKRLGIEDDVEIVSLAPTDFRSVLKVVSTTQPDEIYNLAGQTSVGLSFEQPVECMESIAGATLNLLEVIRYLAHDTKFFNAGSSETFGDTGSAPATEASSFHPRSPYGFAKVASYWQVSTYREAYSMFACTGILSNHESPLRPNRFVTQKIIETVKLIKAGHESVLRLGNIEIWRDWGWAPDYVKAMHLMLQADRPNDYIIASGSTASLREFVEIAFEAADLDINDRLNVDPSLVRPSDVSYSRMNPSRINEELQWFSSTTIKDIVSKMYNNEYF